jgi:hypothetical protein
MQQLLSTLPLLACPLGMGLIMWLMMRGGNSRPDSAGPQPASMTPAQQTELTRLRAELDQLRAEDRDHTPRR